MPTSRRCTSFSAQTGFSLIEMLTAISIFSVLLLIVVSVFTRFTFTQRRDIGEQRLQEDLRIALEVLNRELRTGYGSTFESTGRTIYFRNQNGVCVSYRFEGEALQRADNDRLAPDQSCIQPYTNYRSLTSKGTRIDMNKAAFTVRAATSSEGRLSSQGYVTVRLTAQAAEKAEKTVRIQSTVASRQVTSYRP